jgi:hypothetical protein
MPGQPGSLTGKWGQYNEDLHVVRGFTDRLYSAFTTLVATCEGIGDAPTRTRYAVLLLYRLMFLYFLQQCGLLANDRDYLQHQLQQANQTHGQNFYRDTLQPLFTTTPAHFPVPITTLFITHKIERSCPALTFPNATFARIFALFDEYHWHMDEHHHPGKPEIAPEMLSILFEQAIRQKETGSYYTPADVTGYIVRNTLLPALFTRTRERCQESATAEHALWQQVLRQPARYIFAPARQGSELALPEEISVGLQESTNRQSWQDSASAPYALPGETWREVVARRRLLDDISAHVATIRTDRLQRLVTWNLDQPQLALDTIQQCQQPEVLTAFYQSLRDLTIIDPTCGSGAFLFASLAQLEPLYIACLRRMEELLADLQRDILTDDNRRAFQGYLAESGAPEQRQQTIVIWIIQHNLYGVDILEEAVEICRLRLFLKMLATFPAQQVPDLPDDFGTHIRAGNSLAGSLQTKPEVPVRQQPDMPGQHQPFFHWKQAFPETMRRGGFDVVLGNPPYVEYEQKKHIRKLYTNAGYTTIATGNLYALTIERALQLLASGGRFGMIVPSSATCTDNYRSLQKLLLEQQEVHIASFSDQRGRLFNLPHPRLCIILSEKTVSKQIQPGKVFATPYIKVGDERRASLFERLSYTEVTQQTRPGLIPRYGLPLELDIQYKLASQAHLLGAYLQPDGDHSVYYTRKLSWFVQVTPFIPLILNEQGQRRAPSELKQLRFASSIHADIAFVALNSTLFYWLITTGSDCRNLNLREVLRLPLDLASIQPTHQQRFCQLSQALERDLQANSILRPMHFNGLGKLTIQCMYPARSKQLLDEIDRLLAQHYGFTEEELDFLLHYDYQYRQPRMSSTREKKPVQGC